MNAALKMRSTARRTYARTFKDFCVLVPDSLKAVPHFHRGLFSLVALCLIAGCGGESLIPVSGQVTLDGEPIDGSRLSTASITFQPDASKGNTYTDLPMGRIMEGGAYEIYTKKKNGAPPGWYRIAVFAAEYPEVPPGQAYPGMPIPIIPGVYNDVKTSGLELEVVENAAEGRYDLHLKKSGP